MELLHLLADQPHLVLHGVAVDDLEVAGLRLLVVASLGKEFGVNVQPGLGVAVEDVEQVARCAVVLTQVVDVALAAQPDLVEALHLGSHEGEDGLLLVAEKEHRGTFFRRQQVDDGELHGVEVLDLIDLYPVVPAQSALGVFPVGVVGLQQQVLEVEDVVVGLVLGVAAGVVHFLQQHPHLARHVAGCGVGLVEIVFRTGIEFEERLDGKVHLSAVAEIAERVAVGLGERVGMEVEAPGVAVLHLRHEVGEGEDLLVVAVGLVVAGHALLVVVGVVGQDADGLLVADDGRVGGHYLLLEEEPRTVVVDVADVEWAQVLARHHLADAVDYPAGGAVGEREAEHVLEAHPVAMGPAHAGGQDVGLAAARRSQHEVVAVLGQDDGTLAFVQRTEYFGFLVGHDLMVIVSQR